MSDDAAKQLLESLIASLHSDGQSESTRPSGGSYLVAGDDQFLGSINTNRFDNSSLLNIYGPYGSKYSPTSVFNQYCPYGGRYGQWSPENPYCVRPPTMFINGRNVCNITANTLVPNSISFDRFKELLTNHVDELLSGRFPLFDQPTTQEGPPQYRSGWGHEARIIASDGTFLGKVKSNKFDKESVFNSYGPFGSEYSRTSIFNRYSPYGSEYSAQSAFSKFTATPPQLHVDNQFVAHLTVNPYKTPRVDPLKLEEWARTNGY